MSDQSKSITEPRPWNLDDDRLDSANDSHFAASHEFPNDTEHKAKLSDAGDDLNGLQTNGNGPRLNDADIERGTGRGINSGHAKRINNEFLESGIE